MLVCVGKVSADKKYAWINVDITKTKFRLGYVKRFYDRYDGVIAVSNALYEIILKIGLVDKNVFIACMTY